MYESAAARSLVAAAGSAAAKHFAPLQRPRATARPSPGSEGQGSEGIEKKDLKGKANLRCLATMYI